MQLHEAANILGVSVTADLDTLKAAYRKMALQWHPDKVSGCQGGTEASPAQPAEGA